MKVLAVAALVAGVLLGCGQKSAQQSELAGVQIIGKDDRVLTDRTDFPFGAVGMLRSQWSKGEWSMCTGVLVGKFIALTNRHCVFDNQNKDAMAKLIQFYPAYRKESAPGYSTVVSIIAPETYAYRNDWAIIRFEEPVGEWFGFMTPDANYQGTGTTRPLLYLLGFSGEFFMKYGGPHLEIGCNIIAERYGILSHDCDMRPGASGSPLFYNDGRLLGLNSHEYRHIQKNNAVAASEFVQAIADANAKYP